MGSKDDDGKKGKSRGERPAYLKLLKDGAAAPDSAGTTPLPHAYLPGTQKLMLDFPEHLPHALRGVEKALDELKELDPEFSSFHSHLGGIKAVTEQAENCLTVSISEQQRTRFGIISMELHKMQTGIAQQALAFVENNLHRTNTPELDSAPRAEAVNELAIVAERAKDAITDLSELYRYVQVVRRAIVDELHKGTGHQR